MMGCARNLRRAIGCTHSVLTPHTQSRLVRTRSRSSHRHEVRFTRRMLYQPTSWSSTMSNTHTHTSTAVHRLATSTYSSSEMYTRGFLQKKTRLGYNAVGCLHKEAHQLWPWTHLRRHDLIHRSVGSGPRLLPFSFSSGRLVRTGLPVLFHRIDPFQKR